MLSAFMPIKHSFKGRHLGEEPAASVIDLPDGIGQNDPANNIQDGQLRITWYVAGTGFAPGHC
jgi:hypothetical protein